MKHDFSLIGGLFQKKYQAEDLNVVKSHILEFVTESMVGSYTEKGNALAHWSSNCGNDAGRHAFVTCLKSFLNGGKSRYSISYCSIGLPVISSALSVAVKFNKSGLELIRSILIGYEVMFCISRFFDGSKRNYIAKDYYVSCIGSFLSAAYLFNINEQDVELLTNKLLAFDSNANGVKFDNDLLACEIAKSAETGIVYAELLKNSFFDTCSSLINDEYSLSNNFYIELDVMLKKDWKIHEFKILSDEALEESVESSACTEQSQVEDVLFFAKNRLSSIGMDDDESHDIVNSLLNLDKESSVPDYLNWYY